MTPRRANCPDIEERDRLRWEGSPRDPPGCPILVRAARVELASPGWKPEAQPLYHASVIWHRWLESNQQLVVLTTAVLETAAAPRPHRHLLFANAPSMQAGAQGAGLVVQRMGPLRRADRGD